MKRKHQPYCLKNGYDLSSNQNKYNNNHSIIKNNYSQKLNLDIDTIIKDKNREELELTNIIENDKFYKFCEKKAMEFYSNINKNEDTSIINKTPNSNIINKPAINYPSIVTKPLLFILF